MIAVAMVFLKLAMDCTLSYVFACVVLLYFNLLKESYNFLSFSCAGDILLVCRAMGLGQVVYLEAVRYRFLEVIK